jgi:hypothetical protein
LPIFQSVQKILKTSNIIKNTLNSPATSLVSLNYGVVVVKLRLWAVEQFGRLAKNPSVSGMDHLCSNVGSLAFHLQIAVETPHWFT